MKRCFFHLLLIVIYIAFSCNGRRNHDQATESVTVSDKLTTFTHPRSAIIYCWCFYAEAAKKIKIGIIEKVIRVCSTVKNVEPGELMNISNLKYQITDSAQVNKLEHAFNSGFQEQQAPNSGNDCRFILYFTGGTSPDKTFIYVDDTRFRLGNTYRDYHFNTMDTLFKYFNQKVFDCPS